MFAFGKAAKYTFFISLSAFAYHFYLVHNTKKPEEGFMANPFLLERATSFDWFLYDLKLMLTRPPVEKLLPDRPPAPPGATYPKTLVLNLRGTLIHSEYKFGTGFEVLKRPGLSIFLQRMSRMYEVVIFGDEENGIVNDVCDALDPNYQIIMGRLGRESTLLKNGVYVKDLSYLNRPLKDIVYIDYDDEKC
jgi:import inner membrane translocase subunit TIM50